MQQRIHLSKIESDEKRVVWDEKRKQTDVLRNRFQELQKDQFAAEKQVAVADAEMQNLQRSVRILTDEQLEELRNFSTCKQNLQTSKSCWKISVRCYRK